MNKEASILVNGEEISKVKHLDVSVPEIGAIKENSNFIVERNVADGSEIYLCQDCKPSPSFVINGEYLYMEQVLIEFEGPDVFVCIDKNKKRYIVLHTDVEEDTDYIISLVTTRNLIDMLAAKITIREIFTINKECWKVKSNENVFENIVKTVNTEDLTTKELPICGAYFTIPNEDVREYFRKLTSIENEIKPKMILDSIYEDKTAANVLLDKIRERINELKEDKYICLEQKGFLFEDIYYAEKNIEDAYDYLVSIFKF